jgi:hypothetical protein
VSRRNWIRLLMPVNGGLTASIAPLPQKKQGPPVRSDAYPPDFL